MGAGRPSVRGRRTPAAGGRGRVTPSSVDPVRSIFMGEQPPNCLAVREMF